MKFNKIESVAYDKGYSIDVNGDVFSSSGKQLKLTPYGKYYKFNIKHDNKSVRVKVHRFQAYHKFGDEIYSNGLEIRHLDGCGTNNSWDNIDIGTHSDNMFDIPKAIRVDKARNANKKYSDEMVNEIKQFHSIERSYKLTMEKYNISSKGTLNSLLCH